MQQRKSFMVHQIINFDPAGVIDLSTLRHIEFIRGFIQILRLLIEELSELQMCISIDKLHAMICHVLDLLGNLLPLFLILVPHIGLASLPKDSLVKIGQFLVVSQLIIEHVHMHRIS